MAGTVPRVLTRARIAALFLATATAGSHVNGQATQTVPDYPRLVDFWVHESGPNLEPFSN